MTAPTINMLAPGGAASASFQAQSGTNYTSDAYGVIKNVPVNDVLSLLSANCISLGQSGGRSNFSAAAAPAVGNDSSQDFAAGSRWLDTTNGVEYVCTNPVQGSAVWLKVVSSGAISSLSAVATTGVATGAIYGFATAAQGNAVVALLNALRA